jgi:hypothetical protein
VKAQYHAMPRAKLFHVLTNFICEFVDVLPSLNSLDFWHNYYMIYGAPVISLVVDVREEMGIGVVANIAVVAFVFIIADVVCADFVEIKP